MIWSAIFLRSEDRRGERFLIYLMFSKRYSSKEIFSSQAGLEGSEWRGNAGREGWPYSGLLLEHFQR
jgi:hypothetical protein